MAVTVSRVATDTGGGNLLLRNISFYLGHGPIEFSKITGSLQEFALGRTVIGRLLNHYLGIPYSWEAIQASIGYPNIGPVFITYLGYIYTDFGIVSCVGFTWVWSNYMCKKLVKQGNRISTMYIFSLLSEFLCDGKFCCWTVGICGC